MKETISLAIIITLNLKSKELIDGNLGTLHCNT